MAHTFLTFDFGKNEEAAQEARHKIERWKQGFRLGNKLMLKFDRGEAQESKVESKKAEESPVRVIVRLDFSDHEKLSHQRWIDRIPTEEPFRDGQPKIVRQGDQTFTSVSERFESLD
jgi:hypothetical protein